MDYRLKNIQPPVVLPSPQTTLTPTAYLRQLEEIARALCLQAAATEITAVHYAHLAAQAANVLQAAPEPSKVQENVVQLLDRALENDKDWCEVAPDWADETDEELQDELRAMIALLGGAPKNDVSIEVQTPLLAEAGVAEDSSAKMP